MKQPFCETDRTTGNHAATADMHTGDGIWRGLFTVGLLLTLFYMLIPYGRLAGIIYVITTAFVAITIALAVKHRPYLFCPTAWLLIASALALAACGHAIWYWLDLQGLEPFPSLADVFYLSVYPLFMVALWLLGKQSSQDDGALSDALIVGVAAAVPGWALLIAPNIGDSNLTLLQLLVSTAYPVADLILLPLILRLVFLYQAKVTAHLFLLGGMLAYLIADMLYAHGNSVGWYMPGGLTDGLWLLAYVSIMVAIWHPSAATQPHAHASISELSGRRLIVLGAASMLAPTVILLTAGVDVEVVRVAAIGSILLFLLIMHRMAGLIRKTYQQADELEKLSRTDPLTGAANRRHLEDELERELSRAHRSGSPLTLAFMDLDYFKRFNDTFGHTAGDDLLKEMISAWRPVMRQSDLLARFGGEEFVILLPDTNLDQARQIVERMRQTTPKGQTCSSGIAEYIAGDTAQSLISRADTAMYAAKHAGRDRVVLAHNENQAP